MSRVELENYINEVYNVYAEHPWISYPEYSVFRCSDNKKWLSLIVNVPKLKLGIKSEGLLDVVNLKCGPIMMPSLKSKPGFYPAYHMNKDNWISAALDGSVPDETIKMLLDISFEAVKSKK
ncbi:MAG: MmcQ/YjbR family DNA-binding protein [Clostridiales bacterium]|nr:MmcQ/YjbR family DNA-binding protein [Clostridiales bacterium]